MMGRPKPTESDPYYVKLEETIDGLTKINIHLRGGELVKEDIVENKFGFFERFVGYTYQEKVQLRLEDAQRIAILMGWQFRLCKKMFGGVAE